jgi:hypothetical protein
VKKMTNWVLIYVGKVIAVIEKEGNIDDSDFQGVWDTVAEDPSKTFKVGDEFTGELQLEYNKEIWREMGWYSDPVPQVLPENVENAKLALQNALKEANIDTLIVSAKVDNE